MNGINVKNIGKRVDICIAMPLIVCRFFVALCAVLGIPGFSS